MEKLTIGQWYEDRSAGYGGIDVVHHYRLLEVQILTVTVADLWGNRRLVNRALWERDVVPAQRVPVPPR